MKMISNKVQIAGLPALVIRQFFLECDDPITISNIQSWLNLDDRTALAVFQKLITDGYLETRASRRQLGSLVKTPKARDLVEAACLPPTTREDAYAILMKVLSEIERINGSNEVAHRIDTIMLKGPLIDRPTEVTPYLDMEISIVPLSSDPLTQQNLEALAKEELERRGWQIVDVASQRNWSVRLIEARVLGISPYVCVRTVLRDR